MLRAVIWWRDPSAIYATEVHHRPERAVRLGVGVLDDAGVVRAWDVMRAQVGSSLVPTEAASNERIWTPPFNRSDPAVVAATARSLPPNCQGRNPLLTVTATPLLEGVAAGSRASSRVGRRG